MENKLESRISKLKNLSQVQKRRIEEQTEVISYWQQRCLALEMAAAEKRIRLVPKIARDGHTYTGDELSAAYLAIKNEQDQNSNLVAEITQLRKKLNDVYAKETNCSTEGVLLPVRENIPHQQELRFSPELELGPTTLYSKIHPPTE